MRMITPVLCLLLCNYSLNAALNNDEYAQRFPAHAALKQGNIPQAIALIKNHAVSATACDPDGIDLLLQIPKELQTLEDDCPKPNTKKYVYLARKQLLELAQLLLSKGASPIAIAHVDPKETFTEMPTMQDYFRSVYAGDPKVDQFDDKNTRMTNPFLHGIACKQPAFVALLLEHIPHTTEANGTITFFDRTAEIMPGYALQLAHMPYQSCLDYATWQEKAHDAFEVLLGKPAPRLSIPACNSSSHVANNGTNNDDSNCDIVV